jgi:hypothetical protein
MNFSEHLVFFSLNIVVMMLIGCFVLGLLAALQLKT